MPTLLNNLHENTHLYKNTDFLNDLDKEARNFLFEFSVKLLSIFENSVYSNLQNLFDMYMASSSPLDQNIDFVKDYYKNATNPELHDRFSSSVVNKYYGQIAKNILDYDDSFDTSIENIISCIEENIIKFVPYKSGHSNIFAATKISLSFQNQFNDCIYSVKYEDDRKKITGMKIDSACLITDFMIDSMLHSKSLSSKIHLFSLARKKFLVIYNPKLISTNFLNETPSQFSKRHIFLNDDQFIRDHIITEDYLKEFVSSSLKNKNLNHKRFASKILKTQIFKDYLHDRFLTTKELETINKEDIKIELEKLKSYNNMKDLYTW